MLCSSSSDKGTSQHPHMATDGALEARSHVKWSAWPACAHDGGICHNCAVEPQRHQVDPDETVGRRAGANWAHREAWEGRELDVAGTVT